MIQKVTVDCVNDNMNLFLKMKHLIDRIGQSLIEEDLVVDYNKVVLKI